MWFQLLSAVPFLVALLSAPPSKVEESFNMQAFHDLIFSGGRVGSPLGPWSTNMSEIHTFDHQLFPGVVPRTSLGSLAVAGLAAPWIHSGSLLRRFGWPISERDIAMLISRLVLLCAVLCGVHWLAAATDSLSRSRFSGRRRITISASKWLVTLVCCCCPHVIYYGSRSLPNTYALLLFTVGFGLVLKQRVLAGIAIFAANASIFRSDVAVFAAPLCVSLLLTRTVKFWDGLCTGILSTTATVLFAGLLDGWFWQRGYWFWPELNVLLFNTVDNRSSEWGTSPFAWYFYSALPRGLTAGLPLLLLSLVGLRFTSPGNTFFAVVYPGMSLLFGVLLYSFLPHKEIRFIFIIFPALLVPCAVFLEDIWALRNEARSSSSPQRLAMFVAGSWWRQAFLVTCIFCGLCGSLTASCWMMRVNASGYPGASAIDLVHRDIQRRHLINEYMQKSPPQAPTVFLDAYACMTGVTRFSKLAGVVYSKDPNIFNRSSLSDPNPDHFLGLQPHQLVSQSPIFDYLVVRLKDVRWHTHTGRYTELGRVKMFDGWPSREYEFVSVLRVGGL